MSKLLTIIALFFIYNQLSGQVQSKKITEKYYPDPQLNIATPTNLKPMEKGLCTYDEMMSFLQSKAKVLPEIVRLEIIGKSANGKDIPIVYFGDGKNPKKLKIWMQGGLHGNEPAGSEGLLMLMNYLLETPDGKVLLKKMDIAILPVANIDGYIAQKRTTPDGLDLNRDQTKFSDQVSPILKRAFVAWNPEATFDFHEYTPFQKKGSDEILKGGSAGYYDVLFLPSGNMNVPEGLRKISTRLFQTNAEKVLDRNGYSHNFYFTAKTTPDGIVLAKGGNNPRSSSSNYALSNSVSMLVEIRGIGLGRTSFARRTYSTFLVARSFLETAMGNLKEVKKGVQNAVKQTIARKNNIVVTADETLVNYPVKFIDLTTDDIVTLDMKVYDALLPIATLTRKRPVAYILSPECSKEAGILRIFGLTVTETDKQMTVPVISYTTSSYIIDKEKWEGIYPVTVQTKISQIQKSFPTGSFIVKLDQKNANYAVILLEPESENGFVNMAITKTSLGEQLPFYRLENGKLP